MSDTAAAIRAAREVQSDTLTPELFRQAGEWFYKARKEYKFKNFALAKEYAQRARKLAEQSEFEAIRIGGSRTEVTADPNAGLGIPPPPPPAAPETPPGTVPPVYATPTPTPADVYDQRRAEERALPPPPPAAKAPDLAPTPIPVSPPTLLQPTPVPTR